MSSITLNKHFDFLWPGEEFSIEYFLENYPLVDKRYIVLWGGASSGKSYSISQRLAFDFLFIPNNNLLIIRSVYSDHKNSTYADLINRIKEWDQWDNVTATTSPLSIVNKSNGNKIIFRGTDNVEKLKSITNINKIWIEEADAISKSDFDQLCLRIRGEYYLNHTNQMFISFNPTKEDSWLKKEFFDSDYHKEDAFIDHSTFLDNQYIDDMTREKLIISKKNNPHFYNVYGLGNWGHVEGKIFNNYSIDEFDINQFDRYSIGLDFGSVDPTGIILVAKEHDIIYVCKEYKRSSLTDRDISIILKDEFSNYGCTILADCAQKGQIESLKHDYYIKIASCKKGPDSIIKGIRWLQNKSIVIHPNCKEFIREINNYEWKKIGENYIEQPIDKNNHLLDPLRYACELWMEKKTDQSNYLKSNNVVKFECKW